MIAFFISGLHRGCRQVKPFNPILGETFQARYSDGTSVLCEQVCQFILANNINKNMFVCDEIWCSYWPCVGESPPSSVLFSIDWTPESLSLFRQSWICCVLETQWINWSSNWAKYYVHLWFDESQLVVLCLFLGLICIFWWQRILWWWANHLFHATRCCSRNAVWWSINTCKSACNHLFLSELWRCSITKIQPVNIP